MNSKSILLFVLAISTLGSLAAQQTINGTLLHDGLDREYILYIPDAYDPATPAPLLLSFHGFTSNAQLNFSFTRLSAIADAEGFILIHPQGELFNGITHWNVGGFTIGSTIDDVGFVAALLDDVSNSYNIDQERIYSTGMSNGGYMSFLLACQLSDKIAAVASVTGSMTPQTFNNCDPQHPMPVLQIHGTADDVVPYNGGPVWTKSIDEVLEYWVDYNNCNSSPLVTDVEDTNTADGSTVEYLVYGEGNNCVATEHLKIFNGGHDWPGAWGNMDINASEEVWKFLSQYNINGLIGCETTSTAEASHSDISLNIFPNPASNQLTIEKETADTEAFKIYSRLGEVMLTGQLTSGVNTIDISILSPNIYFFKTENKLVKIIKM